MSTFPTSRPAPQRQVSAVSQQKRWFLDRLGSLVTITVNLGGTDGVDTVDVMGAVHSLELGGFAGAQVQLAVADGTGFVSFPLAAILAAADGDAPAPAPTTTVAASTPF